MNHLRLLSFALVASLSLASLAAAAEPESSEPDGFRGATFGMSPKQVASVMPQVKEVSLRAPAAPAAGETPPPVFPLRQFVLSGQTVGALGPCNLYFNFFRDKLTKIDFYCPDKAKVEAQLTSQFGPARKELGQNHMWGVETLVLYSISLGSFSYTHRALNDSMQTEMIRLYAQPPAGAPAAAQ